jgi:hypothetical protein
MVIAIFYLQRQTTIPLARPRMAEHPPYRTPSRPLSKPDCLLRRASFPYPDGLFVPPITPDKLS